MKSRQLLFIAPLGFLCVVSGGIWLLMGRKQDEKAIREQLTLYQVPYWRSAWGQERLPSSNAREERYGFNVDRITLDELNLFYRGLSPQQGWRERRPPFAGQQLSFTRKDGKMRTFSVRIASQKGDATMHVVISVAPSP